MKRIFSIQLLMLYFGLTVISSVSLHYCHGKLESIYFIKNNINCCGDSETVNKPCCKNVFVLVDFKTDRIVSETLKIVKYNKCILINNTKETNVLLVNNISEFYTNVFPPGDIHKKIYKLHHSFLFYG